MNILIISSNLIGDSILSTGVIKEFINKYPDSKLTIIVGPSAAQVYKNFPNINKLIVIKKQKFSLHWIRIWEKCFFYKWDIIIDFRSSLISYFFLKKKKYIFKHSNDTNQINQLTKFFKLKNIAYPIIFNNSFEKISAKNKLLKYKKYIVIAPGGNWKPKIWPIENFNKLLIKLLHKHSNLSIILAGSKDEKKKFKNNLIKNIDKNKIVDLMEESITHTYAFMKKSNLFIGNDSGLMHLAAASKIPTIGLFGPTNHKLYAPFGNECYIIRTNETYKDFKKMRIDINKSYMLSIKVEDVISIIETKNLI